MNFISLNVQGLGNQAKITWVRDLCSKHKANFLALQETKKETIDVFLVRRMWGNSKFQFSCSESVGASGGILCVWDPELFVKKQAAISDYFVILEGTWTPSKINLMIVTVYAPQDLAEKRSLWGYLAEKITNWSGEVVVMGDFNEVRVESERFGLTFNANGALAFLMTS